MPQPTPPVLGGVAAPGSVLSQQLSPKASEGAGLPLCRLCLHTPGLFLCHMQFPCNALTSNRGKQQPSEQRSTQRAGLSGKAGRSRQQPWCPAALVSSTPPSRVSVFPPREACNNSGVHPAAASLCCALPTSPSIPHRLPAALRQKGRKTPCCTPPWATKPSD